MVDIARARLTQERWFALIRLLLIEAYLFQAQLEPDLGRIFGTRQSVLLIAFGAYALLVVFGVAVRPRRRGSRGNRRRRTAIPAF